jgi:tetraprenyl-beta-curcumene synthase
VTLAVYWLWLFPRARGELRRWQVRAQAIRDPVLQRLALDKLRDEGVCAEGVAAFALLAVAADRPALVRFCVAFEVLYDLLDGLGEQPAADVLANNCQLGRAFTAALDPTAPLVDFYAFHPQGDDGGYVNDLVAACRAVLATLPAYPIVAAALRRAAERAAAAQSLNHSGGLTGDMTPLEHWATEQGDAGGLLWWEVAAAAAAPLGIYALCALATFPDVTAYEVRLVEATYFPWVAGLLGILESMVDCTEDAAAGTTSYAARYRSTDEAATRAALFARRSCEQTPLLRRPHAHRTIIAGMVATNLSHQGASDTMAWHAGRAVRDVAEGPVRPLLLLLRLRRRLKRRRRACAAPDRG